MADAIAPPPVVRWTPEEAPVFADLARVALVATLDGGPTVRAAPATRFSVEITIEDGEPSLVLHLDAARATLAVDPPPPSPSHGDHHWRDVWTLELVHGDAVHELTAGAPAIDLRDLRPRGRRSPPPRIRLRVARRGVVRALDGADQVVPLHDLAFHRYTRQSTSDDGRPSSAGLPRWATPTAAEAAPWWEIDLAAPHHVARVVIDLARPPPGARVVVHAYGFVTPGGAPPPGSLLADVAAAELAGDGGRGQIAVGAAVIARFVRVTLIAGEGAIAPLAVLGAEIVAAEIDAGALIATLARSFALYRDRPLVVARDAAGDYAPIATFGAIWNDAAALARNLMRLDGDGERVLVANLLRDQDSDGERVLVANLLRDRDSDGERVLVANLLRDRDSDGERVLVANMLRDRDSDGERVLVANLLRDRDSDGERVFVANMLRGRPAWLTVDLATLLAGHVSVPIAPDDPDDRLAAILARARPAAIFCEPEHAARVTRLAASGVRVCASDDALAALVVDGAARGEPLPPPRAPGDLYAVLFTSGSTGAPKGVMRSYAAFHAMITSYAIGHTPRHLSFQPLSHLSERMYLPAVLINGGTVGFSRGGAHLLDELRAFEPTTLGSVPRLFEVLYAGHQRRLRAALAAAPSRPRAAVEREVLAETRAGFGRRLLALSVGSAPVGADVLGFLRRAFADVWVSEGYGSTEVGSIAFDGALLAGVEVRLRPAPDAAPGARRSADAPGARRSADAPGARRSADAPGARRSADAPGARRSADGDPERGEIWVKTPFVTSGYLGDAEATAAAIDDDGFFATGDLGERDAEGRVRVIGRVRNTVKLAQGEFVSPERIETVLATAPIVDQIYVHAVPGAPGVAALVVTRPELTADPSGVLAALHARGRAAGLASYELPRGVLIRAEALTAADGLLTASGKLARAALAARFGTALAALTSSATHIDDTADLGADADLQSRVLGAVTRVLGNAVNFTASLDDLGVDSLAAAEILSILADDLGREVPLTWWFESRSLSDLTTRLASYAPDSLPPTADPLITSDLAPGSIGWHPANAGDHLRNVLLTGATGFLGAHLVEAFVDRGVTVTCLVRAADDGAAARRLRAALVARGIPDEVGAQVDAIAGDLADIEACRPIGRVLERCQAIVHAGAMVSWLAPYAALRGVNVGGTVGLAGMAAARGVAFHQVSTISVAPPDGDETAMLGEAAARGATPYVLSKWIAEVQVRRAAEEGLPVTIYRPAMIAGHSTRGTGNPDDFLSRYLVGLCELGCYLDRADAIVDMTPVDFVARAIVGLAVERKARGETWHLANVDRSMDHAALGRALCASGRRLEPVDYATLRARLAAAPRSRLRPLAAFFPERFGLAMGPWPRARTTAVLAELGIVAPRIDDAMIARYVADLARHGSTG